jgi:hypothetical protein
METIRGRGVCRGPVGFPATTATQPPEQLRDGEFSALRRRVLIASRIALVLIWLGPYCQLMKAQA